MRRDVWSWAALIAAAIAACAAPLEHRNARVSPARPWGVGMPIVEWIGTDGRMHRGLVYPLRDGPAP